jgi:hypothetical protein
MNNRIRRAVFSLRTLLLGIALLAIPLSIIARISHLRTAAARHHFLALDYGYRAANAQIPANTRLINRPPPTIKADLQTLSLVNADWQMCIYHSATRDVYLNASETWWRPLPNLPDEPIEVSDDFDYWNNTVLPFVAGNLSLLYSSVDFSRTDPHNGRLNWELLTTEQRLLLQKRIDSADLSPVTYR